MSYKVEVNTVRFGPWDTNSLRFATENEAQLYGNDLFNRWTSVRDYRVVASEDPVNYRWQDNILIPIEA
jgi:hypothetical protein